MHYNISIADPAEHFIRLQWTIAHIHQDQLHLQLPAWRPGRYELQNYAKNVRSFSIADQDGRAVTFRKITKDCWEVETKGVQQLLVTYEYYANQYDAGASYADAHQLYVNPVNCFMYVVGRMDEPYEITLDLPADYTVACQLPVDGHTLHAKDFDTLADSPFIASATLQHATQVEGSCTFHFWFQGTHAIDTERLKKDTAAYAAVQAKLFGDLPCTHYHFLYHILDRPFRHGVEHLDSTVIAMGKPDGQSNEDFYQDLLAISSHELFHLWNIKRIRPTDMLPYDFTKENYSTLGYVYEGVTTYYGDVMLLRSGVWSWELYSKSFASDLKRHVDNPGRFNYSVAESSFDTWLDGYVPGVPGRKTSIYIEGMLAAFVADVMIIRHSDGRYSLGNVMHDLYQEWYKDGRGYTEQDYCRLLEKYAGVSFEAYFRELIHGKGAFESWLREAADAIGCTIDLSAPGIRQVDRPGAEQQKRFARWSGINPAHI